MIITLEKLTNEHPLTNLKKRFIVELLLKKEFLDVEKSSKNNRME